MPLKFRAAPPDSDEDTPIEEDESTQKRIKLIRELSESEKVGKDLFVGGIIVSSEADSNVHSASASLSVAEKKGKKEVEELKRELDLKNTFSNETNRRDEDAEMNRYIDEQIRLRREATKSKETKSGTDTNDQDIDLFTLPSAEATERVDDILLHSLAKIHSTTRDERSEAMLSSQMLNGIPEVDLGIDEKIRTMEATEEAKLRLVSGSRNKSNDPSRSRKANYSNFHHNRSSYAMRHGPDKSRSDHSRGGSGSAKDSAKTVVEPVVAVGEEPREIEYRVQTAKDGKKPPHRSRASDDYHLQKFKKSNRR